MIRCWRYPIVLRESWSSELPVATGRYGGLVYCDALKYCATTSKRLGRDADALLITDGEAEVWRSCLIVGGIGCFHFHL